MKLSPFQLFSIICLSIIFFSCEKLDEIARKNWEKKHDRMHSADSKEVDKWKESLAINEAELKALDKNIQNMVGRTAQTGALSWRIAQAYMKASNFEMGARYYQRAADEQAGRGNSDTNPNSNSGSGGRMAFWDSSLPYFEKSTVYRKIDKELLFEMGLAYANASRDMGWEPERRRRAVDIFINLSRLDTKDTRFPFQLALIYFDSSISSGTWAIQEGYRQIDDAFNLLNEILKVEPENVPTRFAKANFLYQLGKTREAYNEYVMIKNTIEDIDKRGELRGKLKNNRSYQNVLRNIQEIEAKGVN
ncbi:MAG: tetratricopeptide repeat protein [Leptospira sp.]|nr:tetratricopeptide repeat protein [Leptospira sp.]